MVVKYKDKDTKTKRKVTFNLINEDGTWKLYDDPDLGGVTARE
ncbi:MAG: hypothetical protein QM770_15310 [Tepidisphaeraceae bacterium]